MANNTLMLLMMEQHASFTLVSLSSMISRRVGNAAVELAMIGTSSRRLKGAALGHTLMSNKTLSSGKAPLLLMLKLEQRKQKLQT